MRNLPFSQFITWLVAWLAATVLKFVKGEYFHFLGHLFPGTANQRTISS